MIYLFESQSDWDQFNQNLSDAFGVPYVETPVPTDKLENNRHRSTITNPELLSELLTERWKDPNSVYNTTEYRAKVSAGLKGKKQSPETIAKRVKTLTGRKTGPRPPEVVEKVRQSLLAKGSNHTEEHKRKISESVSKSKRGKPLSEEHKAKLRAVAAERRARHLAGL